MKKILIFSALVLLTAACSQNAMQGGTMTSDQCMQRMQQMHQECMKKMQGQGMMQKQGMMQGQGNMMKDCPMMKQMQQQNMGAMQPTTPPSAVAIPIPVPSAQNHEQHHPK